MPVCESEACKLAKLASTPRHMQDMLLAGMSCGGTIHNTAGKRFLSAIMMSLRDIFKLDIIPITTGAAPSVTDTHFRSELKARHTTGLVLKNQESREQFHLFVYGTPDVQVLYSKAMTYVVFTSIELVGSTITTSKHRQLCLSTCGNYVRNNPRFPVIIGMAIRDSSVAKVFSGAVEEGKCILRPISEYDLKTTTGMRQFCETVITI